VSLRGTLALGVAALALGAYVWFVEIRGGEKRAEAEAATRVIFALDPASATALELVTSDGVSPPSDPPDTTKSRFGSLASST